MKIIGLIGGMSWESSAEYYRIVNQVVKEKLGDLHSCKCIMYSVDFSEIAILQHNNKWEELTDMMVHAAQSLERAGAECVVICTNTMHLMADVVQSKISIPLLHIASATGEIIRHQKLHKVGLLGTKFTMEMDFYKDVLRDQFDIDVIIPNEADRMIIHNVIYHELVKGIINEHSITEYKKIIQKLIDEGAQGIILGCTEIPLLIKQADVSVPIFDTTEIHARYAVEFATREQ